MNKFPKTHLWMVLPFIIAFAGFYFSYWSILSEVPFQQHLHGLTATAWYLLLIIQPWLFNQKNLKLHRRVGFIGLFLAGGVVFSALQIVPNNIGNENLSPVLQYGLTWIDFVVILGFSSSVILAMLNSNNLAIHGRYMISSAFWALLPALTRLIYYPMLISTGFPTPISFIAVVYISVAATVLVLGILIWKDYRVEKKVYHPYLFVTGGTLLFGLTFVYMGETGWWIDFCNSIKAQ